MSKGIREVKNLKILTVLRMQVKALPLRRQVTPYLATPRKAATFQSEAGIRAESEAKQISHTAANGEMTWINSS
ncbi:MAG: hypothetical protein F6K50_32695 [Moorea sp. SIO3I7]|uniref:hypothetical protein n=1 Tax=Moorena sp. SIO4A5 TaxID=2607838 RepID=UPI0013CBA39F|nr:hypothetical protein [Moorena sp. SIO4A5]NEO00059.1 hypothetical protein [Moorena sp. SIO3I7]NEO25290.1 hypothetical protein [Moorena sp. SIO4A5]